MPSRTKLTNAAAAKMEISGWERSKITNQDQKSLKRLGLMKKESLIFPGDESYPRPPIGYRLHQLTPNSILHISIFITLCECFLGTDPHWGLWKCIFYLRHNNSRNAVYNVGGVCICVRSDVDYFDVKFPDSVQGWRKKWLYIQEEYVGNQEYGISPFDGAAEILRRRSWDAEGSAEEKTATDAPMKRIHQLQNTHGEELSGIQITAYFLRIRVQPLQARKPPLDPLMDQFIRLGSQSIGFRNEADTLRGRSGAHQSFQLEDCLLAPLPSFFPKQTEPEIFADLVKRFLPQEDLALTYRQENLKIGVEGTIALVANSGQQVDWARAGNFGKINKDKWKTLVKDAKAQSKKIIAFFTPKPAGSSSTAKTELVFDNYTAASGLLDTLPATSRSSKNHVDDVTEDSLNADLSQELNDLRQKLQSMKKQAVIIMDQSRKSSEREKIALQQAQEALTLKETAVAEAVQAASREDYMLDLMTDASLDIAGSFLDAAAENQRVDVRNPSKEIFSNWTKSTPRVLFSHEASKTEGKEVGPRGAATLGRRGPGPGRADLVCGALWPPAPFRLLKASVMKPPPRATIRKTFQTPPPRIPSRGIQEIARTLPERGFISRGLFIAMIARSDE
ncbi:hypothetical protein QYE76_031716 [Lolium multiflorum]|uniref:Transposase (putative) gypsy type domain-containing protein n=1 Tax=Lolium multiflorum TaxID=4521 RepID=A0AAD8VKP3_LOLMU|nr:hypothetical protein QYE76_031716 [Lolium multiflorum]